MLEIVLLFFLCKKLGENLRAKGRNPIGYQIGMVVLWFGSEFAVGFVSALVMAMQTGNTDGDFGIGMYLLALLAAALSAVAMFVFVNLLPPAS